MIDYRAVLHAAREAIVIADVQTGMIVDANRAAESLSGRSIAELRSLHHTRLHAPETVESVRRALERNEETPAPTEGVILGNDGRRIPVEITSSHLTAADGRRLIVSTLRDSSVRDRDREEQRPDVPGFREAVESAAGFKRPPQPENPAAALQAVMDASPAVILVAHGADCRRISGNRTAYRLLRQRPGCNLSSRAQDSQPGYRTFREGITMLPEEMPLRVSASTGQRIRNCEAEVVFDDGSSIHLSGNIEPMLDDEGRLQGAVAVLRDITERHHAAAALRESEKRFEAVADASPVMIWTAGVDKQCTFFNRAWVDFTGRAMERHLGDGWTEAVHPEDLDRCMATYVMAFDARRRFQMEYRVRRADGEYRWVLDSGVPRFREAVFMGYIGSCVDVTEQKVTEERLRASRIQLKDAQRLANLGSSEVDVLAGTVQWSEEMLHIFALPGNAQPNLSVFLSLVHPEDRATLLQTLYKAASSVAPIEAEFRIVRPNGETRFLHSVVEAIKNGAGEAFRFVVATLDITTQMVAMERRRESEQRLRNAERLAHLGNWQVDLAAQHLSCSEEALRIFGHPDREPTFRQLLAAVVSQDRERVLRWARCCLLEKIGRSIEFQIARPDGELRTVICTSDILTDSDGAAVRMVGSCQDVTDLRRAQSKAFARETLETVGALATGIAHDFNNLLGTVVSQAELALTELGEGGRPEKELKRVLETSLRGAEIVRQLMIYAGKESEVLELLDLSQVVREMLELLRVSVSKHAAVETDLAANLPPVLASAAQIRRVVMNLVTNASEAIGACDGVIRVSAARAAITRTDMGVVELAPGGYVRLDVSDTGPGIAPDRRAKVFDPFYTTKSAGRGLGLPVVQGIVRNLHGDIRLDSPPGKGATFQVWLPAAEGRAPVSSCSVAPAHECSRAVHAGTVLVVEDEELLRLAVGKMLRKAGFAVLEASSGSAAIDLLRAEGAVIEMVLLDLTIPGNTSQEVVAAAARVHPDVKVVVTSAYSEETVKAAISSAVIRGFIRKPFRLTDLAQYLRGVLSA
jgi:PAS domain S-box-containing protein